MLSFILPLIYKRVFLKFTAVAIVIVSSLNVSVKSPGLNNPGREMYNQDVPFNEHAFGAYLGSRPFAQSSFVRSRVGAVRRTQTRYL